MLIFEVEEEPKIGKNMKKKMNMTRGWVKGSSREIFISIWGEDKTKKSIIRAEMSSFCNLIYYKFVNARS